MDDLREICEQSGCAEIRTYIQSGNVVFRCGGLEVSRLGTQIEKGIRERCGFDAPVIIRSAEAMEAIVAANPFASTALDENTLHVIFLRDQPDETLVSQLDPDRSPPDQFLVSGREIFLRCPKGVARTKLTNQYFDSKLQTVSTSRNWKTVRTLVEMTRK